MLPEAIVRHYKAKAEGATFFGQPVEHMTRDELLAVIGAAGEEAQGLRAQFRWLVDATAPASIPVRPGVRPTDWPVWAPP